MNDVDELLDIARENINTTQMKQEYETATQSLYDKTKELTAIKD